MTKFVIEKTDLELTGVKATKFRMGSIKYFPGMTQSDEFTHDIYPTEMDSFETLEEAREALKNYECVVTLSGGCVFIDEYYIQEYTYDEDEEEWEMGDIWQYAEFGKMMNF